MRELLRAQPFQLRSYHPSCETHKCAPLFTAFVNLQVYRNLSSGITVHLHFFCATAIWSAVILSVSCVHITMNSNTERKQGHQRELRERSFIYVYPMFYQGSARVFRSLCCMLLGAILSRRCGNYRYVVCIRRPHHQWTKGIVLYLFLSGMRKCSHFSCQTFLSSNIAQMVDHSNGSIDVPVTAVDIPRIYRALKLPAMVPLGRLEHEGE